MKQLLQNTNPNNHVMGMELDIMLYKSLFSLCRTEFIILKNSNHRAALPQIKSYFESQRCLKKNVTLWQRIKSAEGAMMSQLGLNEQA
jgi:hypothetical protein